MPPTGNLYGFGGTLRCPFSVRTRAISADDLDARMRLQPLAESLCCAIRQYINGTPMIEVNQNSSVALPFKKSKIIDPEMFGRYTFGLGGLSYEAEQGHTARRLVHARREPHACFATSRQTEPIVPLSLAACAPGLGRHDTGQALCKDAARAAWRGAKPFPARQVHAHGKIRPREIGEGPQVVAMDTFGRDVAGWTGSACLNGAHGNGELVTIGV
ncbi:MAG: hypothetical protein NVSMB42_04880 [Herpetosiphon sp.]